MKVHKFGGGVIKTADNIKNLGLIIKKVHKKENSLIVISAFDKTTNLLEEVVDLFLKKKNYKKKLKQIYSIHKNIILKLFPLDHHLFYEIDALFEKTTSFLDHTLALTSYHDYFIYDQVVSLGEMLSSKIINAYLNQIKLYNTFLDVKEYIKTDSTYREAKVNWKETIRAISKLKQDKTYITQGFLASDKKGFTTTLGREGSDYSAAIFAYCLCAKALFLWKNQKGILDADPSEFKQLEHRLIHAISYKKASLLSFYGAWIVHPHTFKPLKKKRIAFYIYPFKVSEKKEGTLIGCHEDLDDALPCYMVKKNQGLFSIESKDFISLIKETKSILAFFLKANIQINLIQASGLYLHIVVESKFNQLAFILEELKAKYKVCFLDHLYLYTIFNYNKDTAIKKIIEKKNALLTQFDSKKAHWVLKEKIESL